MAEELFDEIEDREVEGFDIYGQSYKMRLKDFRLRVSVYGVLREGDKVLVQRNPAIKEFSLPGGGVGLGEELETAIVREFFEETGLQVKVRRLYKAYESYYANPGGQSAFVVLIIYLVDKIEGSTENFVAREDSAEAKFISIADLLDGKIQRVFRPVIEELGENDVS